MSAPARHEPPVPLSRPVLWGGLALGLGAAAALSGGVAAHAWIVGSVEGGWTYPYVAKVPLRQLFVFVVIAAGALGLLAVRVSSRNRLGLLLTWIIFATASHALVRTAAPFDLEAIFLSPRANAFYTFAQERDPAHLLAAFDRLRRAAPLHAQSNMPGKTLLVHALQAVTPRTDVLPWLLVVLSNLGAVLAFGLAHALFQDDRAALYAAVLYLFTPGRVLFFPLMNVITPLLVIGLAWLVVWWLRSGRTMPAVAAGVMVYAILFFEPLPLVVGLFLAVLCASALARRTISVERFLVQLGAGALACGVAAAVVFELTGFSAWRAFGQVAAHAVEFNEAAGRPYGAWIRANLWEFVFSAGPAQVALTGAALPAAWRNIRARPGWLAHPEVAVPAGLVAVLLVTNLIGINRGEVARLWIFLACFFQLPAALVCARLGHGAAVAAVLTVTLLQLCLAAAAIAFVMP